MMGDASWSGERLSAEERIARYAKLYSEISNQDFERTLVHYRQRSILEYLREFKPKKIIEVGCGLELLVCAATAENLHYSDWIIVEPATQFANMARRLTSEMSGIKVVEASFENTSAELAPLSGRSDLIIISSLLHEIEDPGQMLTRAFEMLKPGGRVYAIVPNAMSRHRQLAVAMGLIETPSAPSERNLRMMQRRVFNRMSFEQLFRDHQFRVVDSGGMFIKPFTNDQMTLCAPQLSPEVMTGLWRLGREMPDLASEIFVEAQKDISTANTIA